MADSFGDLLRRFRVAASLTQEALAEQCRLSPATIAAIEQGRRKAPRLSTVRLIADALVLSPVDRELLATAASSALTTSARAVPAKAQDAAPGYVAGLQAAWTSFIGREQEQSTILAALAASRVVSLVGPGGVGKTRLAARTAQTIAPRYPLGAFFVDLVPVRQGFLSQAVASLLGVTERPGLSLDAALYAYLAQGRSLLVFDNCEHLIDVVAGFTEKLLADCADVTVLVTSRERLAILGERTVTVPPLSLVAGRGGDAAGSEAAALFLDRARASDPQFTATAADVGELCARLDGVPLAIELAAARSASLGVAGLLAGLDDHLRLLAGNRSAHSRHRSLRAVLDWSYDLLDDDERMMFRRVGVFVGGFDLDAGVAVAAGLGRGMVADLVGRLADKSLLSYAGGSRWQMLETIRAYALDRLSAGTAEETSAFDAHLRWAVSAAQALERQAEAAQPWRAEFDTTAADLRAALARAPAAQRLGHQLACSLGHLAYARRFMVESRQHYWAAAARAAGPDQAVCDLRAVADVAMAEGLGDIAFEVLLDAAEWAETAGDLAAQAACLAHAVTIADRFAAQFDHEVAHDRLCQLLDDARRIAPAGDEVSAAWLSAAAAWLAVPEKTVPNLALADTALAAARLTGDPALLSGALDAVVGGLDAGGRLRDAHQVNKERAQLLARLPRHDPRAGAEIIDSFHMVTEIAVTAGDLPSALATARLAQSDDIASGQPYMAASKPILPLVLQGRFDEALTQAATMWATWCQAGRPSARWMGPAFYGIILAHGLRGDDKGRCDWLARVAVLLGGDGDSVSGTNLAAVAAFTQARIALYEGRLDAAVAATADLPCETQSWYETPHWYSLRAYAWAMAAEVAVAAHGHAAVGRLAAAAPAGDENEWAAACLARAHGRLDADRGAFERSLAGWERIDARFERACTLLLMPDRADEGLAELRALGCRPPAS
ncbi:MAG TPA: helix-turn-helix domain-containing protein [Streptosporangiaceae bacterium]|nr:helix-turn-helix domain-containing protein [Streptosporangiaceae bacterium]